MQLILIRHGKAEPNSPTGRDEDRVLRPRGQEQARFIADTLATSHTPPELILSSGFLRALQTARILQQGLGCTLQIEPALECGATTREALDLINQHRTADESAPPLILVGHNPTFEELATLLTRNSPASPHITLRTGEAAILTLPAPPTHLPGNCTLTDTLRLDGE